MIDYTSNLDLFVRKVKFALCSLETDYLDGVRYCCADEQKYALGYLLFSALQVLSYLREEEASNPRPIALVVAHVLTLLDLEDVGLEPYNLYLRPTHHAATASVLWDGESPITDGVALLQVGAGVISRALTPPTVYEQLPAPTLNSPI